MKTFLIAASSLTMCAMTIQPSIANTNCAQSLEANFIEGAPRDNFTFINLSNERWQVKIIDIDLADSAGQLIFDTEAGGTGVEVFQLYKQESGDATIANVTPPADGADKMKLEFSEFKSQQSFRFSIDVDDTLTNSSLGQIRVTGGELNGATLTVTFANSEQPDNTVTLTGVYGADNSMQLKGQNCT